MFKVKATVVGFLGNEEKYLCHFGYKVGDELVYDGERLIGRVCGDVLPLLIPKFAALYAAGPRYVEPAYYFPFWYFPMDVRDESMKKYDGVGLRSVKQTYVEPSYHLANLIPKNAFKYPPPEERIVLKDITVTCPDYRTAVVFKLEAFDIVERSQPIFRKQMLILSIVLSNPGIELNKIRDKFSKEQREEIYPLAAPPLMQTLIEELELISYLEIQDGRAYITKKGQAKLGGFKASLSEEEIEAIGL